MSREIKFRAWGKEESKMSNVYFINWFCNKCGIEIHGKKRSVPLDSVELIQDTGLKDKNLNNICAGNIVEINGHRYTIEYEIGSFMLVRCSDKTDMYEEFKNCWNDDVYPLSQLYWQNDCEENVIYELEIIGNIYENKDLLE